MVGNQGSSEPDGEPTKLLFFSVCVFRVPVGASVYAVPNLCTRGLCSTKPPIASQDRKSTRLNSSHANISYAVFCLKKKRNTWAILIRRANTIRQTSGTATASAY